MIYIVYKYNMNPKFCIIFTIIEIFACQRPYYGGFSMSQIIEYIAKKKYQKDKQKKLDKSLRGKER